MFVLAGFIAPMERWAEFSSAWQILLDSEPKIDYFKMSEASYGSKQFTKYKGWTKEKRDDKLDKLTEIILKHELFRISVSVNKAAFYRYIASLKGPKPAPVAANPYYLAFHHLVLGLPLNQACNGTGPGDKIDFVFDNQDRVGTRASEAWERVKVMIPKVKMEGISDVTPFLGSPPYFSR